MKNNWLVISVIVALTVATLFFWESPPKLLLPDPAVEERERYPYAVLNDVHSRHYDDSGELSYEFVAAKLRYFRRDFSALSEDDYTMLDSPVLTLYTDDLPWYVSAESGKLTEKGELLTLKDNVRIWQQDDNEQITELNTSALEIQPIKKIVRTEEEVRITSPQGHIEARGMVVDLVTQHIQLLERVRGFHEPI